MKTIKDFTPEIQAKIPEYIARYTDGIFNSKRYKDFDQKNAEALINWNYELCKLKKPVVLVAENPYEAQIFFNYIVANKECFAPILAAIFSMKNGIEIKADDSQLSSQLHSQLGSQLSSQLDSQLNFQLDSQLNSQLYSQLDSQLASQLSSQLSSQLDSQLNFQLDSQLDSQLHSQLGSQLSSQLDSQLNFQLYSQLDSQLNSQLAKKNDDWLFTVSAYGASFIAWYKFIMDEFGVSTSLSDQLNTWNDLHTKSGVYSAIYSELLCIVSKYPKNVIRNERNDLHNPKGQAIEWGYSTEMTKFDCYYIAGRNMPSWIFDGFTKEQFLKEDNEDVRAGMYEIIESKGEGSMLTFLGAEEIDCQTFVHANGELEEMRLFRTKEVFPEEEDLNGRCPAPLAWIKMSCPSTGQNYLIPSDGSFDNCIQAAKFHRPDEVPQDLPYTWHSRN